MPGREDLLKAFGGRVRELRVHAGLSQEHLAELTGLHRTYVGSLERGERNVALINLYALCEALGVQAHDLLPPVPTATSSAGTADASGR